MSLTQFLCQCRLSSPEARRRYFRRMLTPALSLVYVFVGSILIHGAVLRWIAGTIVGAIGLAYGEY